MKTTPFTEQECAEVWAAYLSTTSILRAGVPIAAAWFNPDKPRAHRLATFLATEDHAVGEKRTPVQRDIIKRAWDLADPPTPPVPKET